METQTPAAADIKEDYGNKLVYLTFTGRETSDPATWVVVDPHKSSSIPPQLETCSKEENQIGELKPVSEMQFPDHLDLSKIRCYSSPIYINRKLYVVGGMYLDGDGYPSFYSSKVFIYDFISKTWEEGPHPLRRGRACSVAVAVEGVIYVFGGEINFSGEEVCRKEWCEFYDLNSSGEGWQFLQTPPPPMMPVDKAPLNFHAVHERGNQILLWMYKAGVYSFNYLTKTWSAFDPIIKPATRNIGSVACFSAAVVEDVLFWHYFGVIHAYDLSKKQFLFSKSMDNSISNFGEPQYPGHWPNWSYLLRVGQDTLFLLYWDIYSDKRFHCHRFQIQKSSSSPGECDINLLTDGFGIFDTPGVRPSYDVVTV